MRRIGALSGIGEDDPKSQARAAAFVEALQQLGWTDGRNVRIDHRWAIPTIFENKRRNWPRSNPDVILSGLANTATRGAFSPLGNGFPVVR